jgi:hypothetical protein
MTLSIRSTSWLLIPGSLLLSAGLYAALVFTVVPFLSADDVVAEAALLKVPAICIAAAAIVAMCLSAVPPFLVFVYVSTFVV